MTAPLYTDIDGDGNTLCAAVTDTYLSELSTMTMPASGPSIIGQSHAR